MARTRRSRKRPSVGRRRSGSPSLGSLGGLLFRLEAVGIVLLSLALVSIPWLVPATRGVTDFRDSVVRTFGLLVFLMIALLAYFGLAAFRRRLDELFLTWRPWAIGALCAVFLSGLLGFFRPDWQLGGVDLKDVTAGGDLGYLMAGRPLGVLAWLVAGAAAFSIAWPAGALAVANGLAVAARAAWSWGLPERALAAVRGVMGVLFPTRTPPQGAQKVPLDSVIWAQQSAGGAVANADGDPLASERAARGDDEELDDEEEEDLLPDLGEQMPLPLNGHDPDEEFEDEDEEVDEDGELVAAGKTSERWQLPPLDILLDVVPQEGQPDNALRAQLIVDTLASFGVDARIVQVNEGPTVTQFGLEPGWEVKTRQVPERDPTGRALLDREGRPRVHVEEVSRTRVRVNQITALANDMALALAAPSLRIESPVPGKPFVGLEVPNHTAALVTLRGVIESAQFRRLSLRSRLSLALGQSVAGEAVVADLARMPHLLIAGATGSGKSVCINAIIACILMHASPDEVRFVMIDPKRVELSAFSPIPHLAFSTIVTDLDQVVGTLQAVIHEMETRYRRFASLAVRNVEAYNRHKRCPEKLPYWVMIIDELADLMMAAPYEVEKQICRLAQLARATGIHLIIATQRPSVDVVTGLIKANFPTRIAFAMSSQVDSRTILDTSGAEKLLGRGDMLYLPTDAAKPRRIQGVYVSDKEIESVVEFWTQERFRDLRGETYDHLLDEAKEAAASREPMDGDDPIFEKAKDLAIEHRRISTSMLQRRLRIGYPRAARVMDELEARGVVGPAEGTGSRPVLVGTLEASIPTADED